MKYIVDCRFFSGFVFSTMHDDFHCDYSGNTLQELKQIEQNRYLIKIEDKRLNVLLNRYRKSLTAQIKEISSERYWELYNCLPPERVGFNWFFVGEPYFSDLFPLCFTIKGKYYKTLLSIKATELEINGVINSQVELQEKRATLQKGNPILTHRVGRERMNYVPYYFISDSTPKFINYLGVENGNKCADKENRNRLAKQIRNLKNNYFQYFNVYSEIDDVFDFLKWIKEKHYTLAGSPKLFIAKQREYVDFMGKVMECPMNFCYRIYSRNLFMKLINILRAIKRKNNQ